MYGAILTPPVTPEADYGILFMHNEATRRCAATASSLSRRSWLRPGRSAMSRQPPGSRGTPAGFVSARATLEGGRVTEVAFENVPSFVYAAAVPVETPFGVFEAPVVFGERSTRWRPRRKA